MSNAFKISVIIPAHNAASFIETPLNSLLAQTMKDFEVVIVDDGSEDKTSKVLQSFIEKHRLDWSLVRQENKGVAMARNKGMSLAQGTYLLFLDSDDYLANDALERFYHTCEQHQVDLCFSSFVKVYPSRKQKVHRYKERKYTKEALMKLAFRRLVTLSMGNTLFKRSLVVDNQLKFGRYKYAEDTHFFLDLLWHVKGAYAISAPLFFYVQNESSAMHKPYSKARLDAIVASLDLIKKYEERTLNQSLIHCLNIFLINEIKGNIKAYWDSYRQIAMTKFRAYYPKEYVPLRYFLTTSRTLWLLFLLVFYQYSRLIFFFKRQIDA